jgi:hypothetical protein
MLSFINKFIDNNVEYTDMSEYTIYLKIINKDGNLYDTVAYLINKMLSGNEVIFSHV